MCGLAPGGAFLGRKGGKGVAAVAALYVPAPSSPGRPKALAARRPARLLPPAPQPPYGPLSLRSPRPWASAPGSGLVGLRRGRGRAALPASIARGSGSGKAGLWPPLRGFGLAFASALGLAGRPFRVPPLASPLASPRPGLGPPCPCGRSGRRVGLACGVCVALLLARAPPAGGAAPCGGVAPSGRWGGVPPPRRRPCPAGRPPRGPHIAFRFSRRSRRRRICPTNKYRSCGLVWYTGELRGVPSDTA